MAYKEKRLNKAQIQALYNELGSTEASKPKKQTGSKQTGSKASGKTTAKKSK